jgi:hypothetical protein
LIGKEQGEKGISFQKALLTDEERGRITKKEKPMIELTAEERRELENDPPRVLDP